MTPANIDLATSEALKIAREVDPDGETHQSNIIFSTCTALFIMVFTKIAWIKLLLVGH